MSRSDSGDKLEQAEAILADESDSRRIAAVRTMLRSFESEDTPTDEMQEQWMWIWVIETLLRMDDSSATADEIQDLRQQIASLRRAVRTDRPQPDNVGG